MAKWAVRKLCEELKGIGDVVIKNLILSDIAPMVSGLGVTLLLIPYGILLKFNYFLFKRF